MIKLDSKAISRQEFITVGSFYHNSKDKFKLKLFTDEAGFDKKIYEQNLHRPGLALAGFVDLFSYSRIQVFGNTEMRYLNQLSDD
jgi:HPr kinase/phosphorylase